MDNIRFNIDIHNKRVNVFGLLAFRETTVPVSICNFNGYDPVSLYFRILFEDELCASIDGFVDNMDGTASGLLNLNTTGFERAFAGTSDRCERDFTLTIRYTLADTNHLLVNDIIRVINNPEYDGLDEPTRVILTFPGFIRGSDHIENILALPNPVVNDLWIATNSCPMCDPSGITGDGFVYTIDGWINIGQIRGPVGPAGIQEYDPNYVYNLNEFVASSGALYISLIDNNVGNTPLTSESDWARYPLDCLEKYDVTKVYNQFDFCYFEGRLFYSLVDHNYNHYPPSSATFWADYSLNYMVGILQYEQSNVYHKLDFCSFNGKIYVSAVNDNIGNQPDLSPTEWEVYGSSGSSDSISPYDVIKVYDVDEFCTFSGSLYRSLVNLNIGNQPDISPSQWAIYVPESILFEYDATHTYNSDFFCSFNGKLYYSLVDNNVGNQPDTSPTEWAEYSSGGGGGDVDESLLMTIAWLCK